MKLPHERNFGLFLFLFSNFSVSSALRNGPSAWYVIAANDTHRFLDIFSKNNVSVEDTSSIQESV
jgi:hypothetical protein